MNIDVLFLFIKSKVDEINLYPIGISIIGIRGILPVFPKGAKPRTEVMIMPEMTLRKNMTLLVLGDDAKIQRCFK